MPDPLPIEVIAARIARLALAEHPSIGRLGPGPVLTVVRDTTSGKIYVGLNTASRKNFLMYYTKLYWHKAQGFGKAKSML